DEPYVAELKELPPLLEYAFLEGDDKLPVIIAKYLSVEEKTALITILKSHKRAIAWKLSEIKETNLCLNWEKSHFMVKEVIVLGHKISKQGIEVDKAKVDVINKLPHPTNVKGIRSFLGHAGFYRRFIKDFSKIARPMTRGTKPDKNGKRGEARKSLKQLQLKEEEKTKKTKKEWPKTYIRIKSYSTLKERRKEKGQNCKSSKVQPQGPKLPTAHRCDAKDGLCK
nr:reverse transcriptase domain-containing protein [Tanacetum cinerariifolium]